MRDLSAANTILQPCLPNTGGDTGEPCEAPEVVGMITAGSVAHVKALSPLSLQSSTPFFATDARSISLSSESGISGLFYRTYPSSMKYADVALSLLRAVAPGMLFSVVASESEEDIASMNYFVTQLGNLKPFFYGSISCDASNVAARAQEVSRSGSRAVVLFFSGQGELLLDFTKSMNTAFPTDEVPAPVSILSTKDYDAAEAIADTEGVVAMRSIYEGAFLLEQERADAKAETHLFQETRKRTMDLPRCEICLNVGDAIATLVRTLAAQRMETASGDSANGGNGDSTRVWSQVPRPYVANMLEEGSAPPSIMRWDMGDAVFDRAQQLRFEGLRVNITFTGSESTSGMIKIWQQQNSLRMPVGSYDVGLGAIPNSLVMAQMSAREARISLTKANFKFSNGMRQLPAASSFIKVLFSSFEHENPIDYFDQNCEYFTKVGSNLAEELADLPPTRCTGPLVEQCQFFMIKLTRPAVQQCMGGLVPVIWEDLVDKVLSENGKMEYVPYFAYGKQEDLLRALRWSKDAESINVFAHAVFPASGDLIRPPLQMVPVFDGSVLAVRESPTAENDMWASFSPFDGGLWGMVVGLLFIAANLMWLFEIGEKNPDMPSAYFHALPTILSVGLGSFVFQSAGIRFKGWGTRLLQVGMMFFMFIILTLFVSFSTARFTENIRSSTTSSLLAPITTFKAMGHSSLQVYTTTPELQALLQRDDLIPRIKGSLANFPDDFRSGKYSTRDRDHNLGPLTIENTVNWMKDKSISAQGRVLVMEFMHARKFFPMCDLQMAPMPLTVPSLRYSFVVRDMPGVDLAGQLNAAINRLYSTGDAAGWIQKFMYNTFLLRQCSDSPGDRLRDSTAPRTLADFVAPFFVFLGFLGLAGMLQMLQCIIRRFGLCWEDFNDEIDSKGRERSRLTTKGTLELSNI